jgi:hypothetical protein
MVSSICPESMLFSIHDLLPYFIRKLAHEKVLNVFYPVVKRLRYVVRHIVTFNSWVKTTSVS